jgi:hypothetical protein
MGVGVKGFVSTFICEGMWIFHSSKDFCLLFYFDVSCLYFFSSNKVYSAIFYLIC